MCATVQRENECPVPQADLREGGYRRRECVCARPPAGTRPERLRGFVCGETLVRVTLNYLRFPPPDNAHKGQGGQKRIHPPGVLNVSCMWLARETLCTRQPRGTPTQQLTLGRRARKIETPGRRASRVVLDPPPAVRGSLWPVRGAFEVMCARASVECVVRV